MQQLRIRIHHPAALGNWLPTAEQTADSQPNLFGHAHQFLLVEARLHQPPPCQPALPVERQQTRPRHHAKFVELEGVTAVVLPIVEQNPLHRLGVIEQVHIPKAHRIAQHMAVRLHRPQHKSERVALHLPRLAQGNAVGRSREKHRRDEGRGTNDE